MLASCIMTAASLLCYQGYAAVSFMVIVNMCGLMLLVAWCSSSANLALFDGLYTLVSPCSLLSMAWYVGSTDYLVWSNWPLFCIIVAALNPRLHCQTNVACCLSTLMISVPILMELSPSMAFLTAVLALLWPSLTGRASSSTAAVMCECTQFGDAQLPLEEPTRMLADGLCLYHCFACAVISSRMST